MELDHWEKKFDALKPYMALVDTRMGDFAVYTHDNIVSYAIRLYGEYCHAEVNVMCRYLKKESGYLDVGTNIGYHARAVQKQSGCDVMGFEPNPNHFVVASYNCQGLPIQIVNAAVGNHSGKTHIKNFVPDQIENFGNISIVESGGDEVELIMLDQLNITKCDLIKIDVEGFELQVLEGATRILEKFNPVVFYEAQEEELWPECWQFLEDRGYRQYWVACRNSPIGVTHRKPDIDNPFGTSGVMNILAVPADKEQPTDFMPVIKNQQFADAVKQHKNNIYFTKHY